MGRHEYPPFDPTKPRLVPERRPDPEAKAHFPERPQQVEVPTPGQSPPADTLAQARPPMENLPIVDQQAAGLTIEEASRLFPPEGPGHRYVADAIQQITYWSGEIVNKMERDRNSDTPPLAEECREPLDNIMAAFRTLDRIASGEELKPEPDEYYTTELADSWFRLFVALENASDEASERYQCAINEYTELDYEEKNAVIGNIPRSVVVNQQLPPKVQDFLDKYLQGNDLDENINQEYPVNLRFHISQQAKDERNAALAKAAKLTLEMGTLLSIWSSARRFEDEFDYAYYHDPDSPRYQEDPIIKKLTLEAASVDFQEQVDARSSKTTSLRNAGLARMDSVNNS